MGCASGLFLSGCPVPAACRGRRASATDACGPQHACAACGGSHLDGEVARHVVVGVQHDVPRPGVAELCQVRGDVRARRGWLAHVQRVEPALQHGACHGGLARRQRLRGDDDQSHDRSSRPVRISPAGARSRNSAGPDGGRRAGRSPTRAGAVRGRCGYVVSRFQPQKGVSSVTNSASRRPRSSSQPACPYSYVHVKRKRRSPGALDVVCRLSLMARGCLSRLA